MKNVIFMFQGAVNERRPYIHREYQDKWTTITLYFLFMLYACKPTSLLGFFVTLKPLWGSAVLDTCEHMKNDVQFELIQILIIVFLLLRQGLMKPKLVLSLLYMLSGLELLIFLPSTSKMLTTVFINFFHTITTLLDK